MAAKRVHDGPRGGRHTPRLWPVWVTAPLALLAAIGAGVAVYLLLEGFVPAVEARKAVSKLEIIKLTLAVAGFVGAVLAGVYAYRKQRLSEGDSQRADAEQLAARYSTATEQLGHDSAAVRLGGAYAMAHLADDWHEQRQVCIDVLCAYLRLPYEPDQELPKHKDGDRAVRSAIVLIIRDHLSDPESPITWCGYDLNFTGAVFDDADFSECHFTAGEVSFAEAVFCGQDIGFYRAHFSGADVNFYGATFASGSVNFYQAEFSGGFVNWTIAALNGGDLLFAEVKFLGGFVFFRTMFLGTGRMVFQRASFGGCTVSFDGSEFMGTRVIFDRASFSAGWVAFLDADHSAGKISFEDAEFGDCKIIWGPFSPDADNDLPMEGRLSRIGLAEWESRSRKARLLRRGRLALNSSLRASHEVSAWLRREGIQRVRSRRSPHGE